MKKFIAISVVTMLFAANLFAAFTAPTEAQLNSAADNPALIKDLIKDATPVQAAEVVKAVIAKIVVKKLSAAQQTQAINGVIAQAFAAMPDNTVALARALGMVVGADTSLAGVVDTISAAVKSAAGNQSGPVMQAFNAGLSSGRAGGKGLNLPPVAGGYDVQRLK